MTQPTASPEPEPQSTSYSIKCGLASFIATYIAGVMHPLDLIKTRFQSMPIPIAQATTASPAPTTRCPSTRGCSGGCGRSTGTRG